MKKYWLLSETNIYQSGIFKHISNMCIDKIFCIMNTQAVLACTFLYILNPPSAYNKRGAFPSHCERHFASFSLYSFQNPALSYIKRRRILSRFQKYKLTLVTKCTYQKIFQVFFKHINLPFLRFFQLKLKKTCDRCILSLR
jgi:hypothetical protein